MLLVNLKSAIPQNFRSLVKSKILRPLQRQANSLLDILSTEYNYRFRRQEIQKRLEEVRELPRGLHIEGTNICNAKCTFCAYPQMERPKQTMPMDQFRRVIDEYVAMGGKYVSLTPIVGDPFVDPHLFERLDYLYQCPEIEGFYFYTNAILMKPEVSEKLLAYADKLMVYVSFGGFDRETYKAIMGVDQFDRVRRHIESFIQLKIQTNSPIKFVLSVRCSLGQCTGDFWRYIRSNEVKGVLALQIPDYGFDSWGGKIKDEDLLKVGLEPMQKPHKLGACELLYMKPVILANGKVNACACRDVEAELIVGDVQKSSLTEIWQSKAIQEIIDRHERGDFPEICKRCTWYVSVYNQRRSTILKPLLNWQDEGNSDGFKLFHENSYM